VLQGGFHLLEELGVGGMRAEGGHSGECIGTRMIASSPDCEAPTMFEHFFSILHKGGLVMWPLLALSLVSVTLSFERGLYWIRQNGPASKRGFVKLMEAFRRGDRSHVEALCETSDTVYSRVALSLLHDGASDAVAVGAVEAERIHMDRFMATLSTIITAAPMLGILGTVTGIITSFDLLSGGQAMVDPRAVSGGISEALVATASGLVVALISLFPFMGYGAQRENTLGRLETMIAVAQLTLGATPPPRGMSPREKPSTDKTRQTEQPPDEVGVRG
jgi:biopolymer transport protein ExbB